MQNRLNTKPDFPVWSYSYWKYIIEPCISDKRLIFWIECTSSFLSVEGKSTAGYT